MIKNIILKDFKIHSNINIELGGLTICTGQNGMGKSSLLQSLLLLRQSCTNFLPIEGLNLKGDLFDPGTANDLECQSSNDGVLQIILSVEDGKDIQFQFSYDVDTYDTYLPAVGIIPETEELKLLPLFSSDFQYIGADRLGPQNSYTRNSDVVQFKQQISKLKGQCEFVVHFLYHYGKKIHCHPALVLEDSINDTLEEQVHQWMQFVSPKVNIDINQQGSELKLSYKFNRENNQPTEEISAINVGYGVSYALPIVVAILSSRPGTLLLIENPEAHIHPRAQAELMKLIMRAVKVGIQIIIETHSDHIMNGALIAVSKDSSLHNQVKAYYFERDDKEHSSRPVCLKILEDGRVLNPPKGFFDQIDLDMETLMGF